MEQEAATEVTPLISESLRDRPSNEDDDIFARFSWREKQSILIICTCCSLLTFLASGSFVPTIAIVARDLHTTVAAINVTLAIYMSTVAAGGLIWGTYSSFYGRRPVYLYSLPLYIIGSFGVGASRNLWHLGIMRALQGFGTSCFATVGIATISDVFRVEERGRALGVYFGAVMLGPAIAPLLGGAVSRFFSWRIMQLGLAVGSLICLFLILSLMPETSHPGTTGYEKWDGATEGRRRFVILNPLKSLKLLQSFNLLFTATVASIGLASDYYLLIPLAEVWSKNFNITNEFLIGAIFLPSGLGNMAGAPIIGWISDHLIINRRRRQGGYVPEDRLLAAWPGTFLLVPLSVIGYGYTTQYLSLHHTTAAIVMNIIWLLANGIGVDFAMGPCNVYGVDILHTRSAEVVAALSFFRHVLVAFVAAFIIPMIDAIGIARTGLAFGIASWVSCVLLWILHKYGKTLREWNDIGYTVKQI